MVHLLIVSLMYEFDSPFPQYLYTSHISKIIIHNNKSIK